MENKEEKAVEPAPTETEETVSEKKKNTKLKGGKAVLSKKLESSQIARINILRTNDNRIMVDLKALELLLGNHLISIYYGTKKTDDDPQTFLCVKQTLESINDTAVLRIQEQNSTATRYQNNTIKEIELDSSKLFK